FVPIRLAGLGFEPFVAGTLIVVLAVGGFIGCFVAGPMMKRFGMARAYIIGLAMLLCAHAILALTADPLPWGVSRLIYGTAVSQLFVVTYSWINGSVTNKARGRVQTVFYSCFIVGMGVGGYGISFMDVTTNVSPRVSMVLTTLAVIPLLVPGLPTVNVAQDSAIRLKRTWQISPVGFMGMFFVGGLTLLVQGFAPIYGQAVGFAPAQIGFMLLLMQIGIIGVQIPAGVISDRWDRRWVLIACALMITAFAGLTSQVTGLNFFILVAAFALWAGATETIFSISTAQSNDHAKPDEYVMLAATLTMIWSIGATLIPAITSVLTKFFGATAYMYTAGALGLIYAIFVAFRMTMREVPQPDSTAEAHALHEPPRY
ncbi:MAG: MFS transporter, partial [Alphaproteobacteria bacterium]